MHQETSVKKSSVTLPKCLMLFMVPILIRGRRGDFSSLNLRKLLRPDESQVQGSKLDANYRKLKRTCRGQGCFLHAVVRTFGPQFLLITLLDVCAQIISMPLQIISMSWITQDLHRYSQLKNSQLPVEFSNATSISSSNSSSEIIGDIGELERQVHFAILLDATILALSTFATVVLMHPRTIKAYHVGLKCRAAASHMIYNKSLALSMGSFARTTAGQVVNLLSNDVNRFDQASQVLPSLISAPLQAAVVLLALALCYLGLYPTLASLLTFLTCMLCQGLIGRAFSMFRDSTARRTDERVRLINEIVCAIRVIKMYAWEDSFASLVKRARRAEMNIIALTSVFKIINHTIFFMSCKVIVFVGLVSYMLLGNELNSTVVFATIGFSNLIRLSLGLNFSNALAYSAETILSCKRINDFLELPEKNSLENHLDHYNKFKQQQTGKPAIEMQQVQASWQCASTSSSGNDCSSESQAKLNILKSLSLIIPSQDLVFVVGKVGSGKSSFLLSILAELPPSSGHLQVNGRLSYAPQEAWLFAGTVRENILLRKSELNQERYDEVIRVCALERDLNLLQQGDLSQVGERGCALSGGQKARVNLARALYHEADIYLLDDPLSAVDAPVAKHIFSEAIQKFLKGKTVILATHQLQFLSLANKVLLLDGDGQPVFGSLQQVRQSQVFKRLEFGMEAFAEATATNEQAKGAPSAGRFSRPSSPISEVFSIESFADENPSKPLAATTIDSSATESHLVSSIVYYAKNASSICGLVLFLVINLGTQAVFHSIDIFLSLWCNTAEHDHLTRPFISTGDSLLVSSNNNNSGEPPLEATNLFERLTRSELIGVYAIMVLVCALLVFLRAVGFYLGATRASINIHKKFFNGLLQTAIAFFDSTPIGTLLNRIGGDFGFVDEMFPEVAFTLLVIFTNVAGDLVVSILVQPFNLALVGLLTVMITLLRLFCSRTLLTFKEFEGSSRGPMLSHVSASLLGLSTIRAFQVECEFSLKFNQYQDHHCGVWLLYAYASRLFAVAVELLTATFILLVVFLSVTLLLDTMNASTVGLIIIQIGLLPIPIQNGMMQLMELESEAESIARLQECSKLKPEEAPSDQLKALVPIKLGALTFSNVSLRYNDNGGEEQPVLNDICLSIEAGEKIGVVGRTGAGKSSLIAALFRLYPFEGSVQIDGQDTKQMSLRQLRSSISIIPQEPVLFAGSLRKNLDPIGERADSDLWFALDAVQLRPMFDRLPQGLGFEIQDGGSNLSVGQRQLLCLARAILRRNKILVMDEATASVDVDTDELIKQTIAQQFALCTVITVAHRLQTIAEVDRVLVLDRGSVKEFDEPYVLLSDRSSLFASMVDSSQGQRGSRIRKLIERAHETRRAFRKL